MTTCKAANTAGSATAYARDFLRIGGLALGGLACRESSRAERRSTESASHKAVIMVFLAGGPPHQDMLDLKPDAPAEIRGEFKPIATNVARHRDLRASSRTGRRSWTRSP